MDEVALIEALYNQGYSVSEIGTKFGVGVQVINQCFRQYSISRERNVVTISQEEERDIKRLYLEGEKISELAKLYNVTPTIIKDKLKTHKVKFFRKSKFEQEDQAAFNQLLSTYKCNAKRRGLSFELSEEIFRGLTKSKCYYCGIEPHLISKGVANDSRYVYNGVDRNDSRLGYIVNNCHPCCRTCNTAKSNMTEEDFWRWLGRVFQHSKEKVNQYTILE